MAEERSFLSRWAQRKQQALEGEVLDEPEVAAPEEVADEEVATVVDADGASAVTAEVVSAESEAETLLGAEDLPDPDSIEIGGSFASFMANNVDPDVKKNALRALWKQPHFSEIDGMMEYALDYSCQPTLSAEVSSELAKKVFRHLIEKTEEAVTELADEPVPAVTEAEMPAPTLLADNLDEAITADSQNATLPAAEPDKGVV
ncbi:DUF3306 domain-containing protein [Shewanella fodinae]|uniref:Uncharacterized protein DUF3306 n=1 Tax=Shewanella fodinae TaxID=552357 RepID=A0A4R2FIL6_9GAMM|nr:DUF3306 domain-containing protein [Shewanella fodinae]TCN87055.1 uncharacterized protein DUF3306 [Shewanella fodinae]